MSATPVSDASQQAPLNSGLRSGWLLVWSAVVALSAVDIAWLLMTPISLGEGYVADLSALAFMVCATLYASSRFERNSRPWLGLTGAAFLFAAWPALRIFNHLSMSAGFPMADPLLASWDAAIAFDWFGYVSFFDGYPAILKLMALTYTGLAGYSAVLYAVLLFGDSPAQRCFEMIALFMLTAVTCMIVGMAFPAESAMAFYGHPEGTFTYLGPGTGTYHLVSLDSLRNEAAPVLDLDYLPGLVTFPSFHTAMGCVAIYCARGKGAVFAAILAINLLMIASTPILGSHYGIDVIAGAMVTLAAIAAYRMLQSRVDRTADRATNAGDIGFATTAD